MGNALAKLSPCSIASDADYAILFGQASQRETAVGIHDIVACDCFGTVPQTFLANV